MIKPYKKYLVSDTGEFKDSKTGKTIPWRIALDGYPWVGGEKVWRVVAELFIPIPEELTKVDRICVNHKDGNKLNNSVSNLEWCTIAYNNYHARITGLNDISGSNSRRWNDKEFRKRVSKNISAGRKRSWSAKFKNNPKFKYLVIDNNGKEYTRQEVHQLLGFSQSYTDVLIKKVSMGNYHHLFKKHGLTVINTNQGQSTIEN